MLHCVVLRYIVLYYVALCFTVLHCCYNLPSDISLLRELVTEHTSQKLPPDDLLTHLNEVTATSDELIEAARMLVNKKLNCR